MHVLVHSRECVFVIGYYECRLRGWGRVEIVVDGWCGTGIEHNMKTNSTQKLSEVFQEKYDPENSGFISTERFRDLLAAHGSELDPHKLEVLLALADGNADGKICYQDFVNLVSSADELEMSNKRSNSFRRAILQGSRQLRNSALREEVGLGLSRRLVRHVAYETLPREVDRKWYFDSYTYCPPPWLMLVITIAEVRPHAATTDKGGKVGALEVGKGWQEEWVKGW
ncbi:Rhomboid-related protein 3 [Anabarilius grahami]|uniref:rhomboid protease n=1 Tax=Anabarilius grahami TaxID=495550 RepID=A0A3N0XFU9_ANAGA|nr:Rhomboid-related protein 3 [Anabarilius grahami]